MTFKTIAIIQGRMASSRLPGKVLLDIADKPALVHVIERTRRARSIDEIVVATTDSALDDPIEALCQQQNFLVYRGSEHDVLDRYYQVARIYQADVIVRITADCPVIDPQVIDRTVYTFLGHDRSEDQIQPNSSQGSAYRWDFAANRLPPPWGRTYPIGLDTEVVHFPALEIAWQEATKPHQREHVMPFFYEQPDRFRILLVDYQKDYGHLRWTLDTPEDLELLRRIFANFADRNDFSWLDILDLFEREPQLAQINADILPKNYQSFDDRQHSEYQNLG